MKFLCCFISLIALLSSMAFAQSRVVVFQEPGFPAADSAPVPQSFLRHALPEAQFASAAELKQQFASANLLVLPYGSAFPEENWPEIYSFLQRGGNLLVLGGRPFSRAAYRDDNQWKLRDYSVRYMRPLRIDQYEETPGSADLKFESNPDIPLSIPQFSWKKGWSPVIRLSAVDLYNRAGSAGSIDSQLDALASGTKDGRNISAPVIEIDHFRNGFDGGRWIFVDADLGGDFYSSPTGAGIISKLADQALQGAEEFTVRPVMPLYLPGEPVEIDAQCRTSNHANAEVLITLSAGEPQPAFSPLPMPLPLKQPLVFPAPQEKGLHIITALLRVDGKTRATYHSAFWIRDLDYLRSGPKLSVNHDYFELDGKPLAVLGTTYMSSEVQRLYFDHPNVYVWDRDMRQIHEAGLNMLRTGWWTGWDKFFDENGAPYERTLRTLEAYLMTARKYGLPVQFNIFAFLPDVLGGQNSYLDPEAVRRQKTLVSAIAARFHDVPFLAYDLINEPSFSKQLWKMRPNGDPIELQKWTEWLDHRYPNRAALAAAWNVPITSVQGAIALPEDIDFSSRGMYTGHNSLKIYDYTMFAQESFTNWVHELREAIRAAGSNQLITVGQDEGGYADRLSPAFFAPEVDFTTNHTWWQNDYLLWDSLVAKQPGKPMLIQETGLQRELNLDETARRTPENEAALLERKIAMSFVHGSGAIEWLWNTNSYMTEANETPIGAVRPDGTEKPEATVLRNFAKFAAELSPHLRNPEPAQLAVIASQAAQYSALADFQLEAQRKAVRALAYYDHLTPYVVYENHIDQMGSPKLAILPSAQALSEKAWQELLKYVENGGNLLITGPINRDEHGQKMDRAGQLVPGTKEQALTVHTARIAIPAYEIVNGPRRFLVDDEIPLEFDQEAQNWLDVLSFSEPSASGESRTSSCAITAHGKGHIFWAAYPTELAQGEEPAAHFYSWVARQIGLEPQFEAAGLRPTVMVVPLSMEDSMLYIVVSDDANRAAVDLIDKSTGVHLALKMRPEHTALALIGKKEKKVIATYGF